MGHRNLFLKDAFMKSIVIHPLVLAILIFSSLFVHLGQADPQVKTLTEQLRAKASASARLTLPRLLLEIL